MIHHADPQFVYVHIPKTAGTSVDVCLSGTLFGVGHLDKLSRKLRVEAHLPVRGLPGQHAKYRKHRLRRPAGDYFRFSIVRHPLTRAVSQISYLRQGKAGQDFFNGSCWKDWLMKLAAAERKFIWGHDLGACQVDYLTDESRQLAMDYVGRFEDLALVWRRICRRLGFPIIPLGHVLKGNSVDCSRYFDEESTEALVAKYARDFEAFGYLTAIPLSGLGTIASKSGSGWALASMTLKLASSILGPEADKQAKGMGSVTFSDCAHARSFHLAPTTFIFYPFRISTVPMKSIILAGGSGSRLDPLTRVCCKQLLPLYDKPMIYYPLATLMLAGLRQHLIITTPQDQPAFENLLGDGSQLGIEIQYKIQPAPDGIAQAPNLAREFLAGSPSCLILGDNVFYGNLDFVRRAICEFERTGTGATVFAYEVQDPTPFAVVEFDAEGRVLSLEEKPKHPKSSFAVPGLYLLDGSAPRRSSSLRPSARGELEITDLLLSYHTEKQLRIERMGRGFAWLDTGTPQTMLEAAQFIAAIQKRQNLQVACLEEIAWRNGWLTDSQLVDLAGRERNSIHREYLERLQSP